MSYKSHSTQEMKGTFFSLSTLIRPIIDGLSWVFFVFFCFCLCFCFSKNDVIILTGENGLILRLLPFLYAAFFFINHGKLISPVGWGFRKHRLHLCREVKRPKRVSWYDIKQSDDDVPAKGDSVMLSIETILLLDITPWNKIKKLS